MIYVEEFLELFLKKHKKKIELVLLLPTSYLNPWVLWQHEVFHLYKGMTLFRRRRIGS